MEQKNKYFATIYKSVLDGDNIRSIHKKLFNDTINSKVISKPLLAYAIKLSNKAKKVEKLDADVLFMLLKKEKCNDIAKKIINHEVSKEAEIQKSAYISDFIDKSRKKGEYFYLASSHTDCALDHVKYQGRLYVDENAPEEAIQYAKSRGLYTLQWVMDAPAWFITRPNCRHYFVSLTLSQVRGKSDKKLIQKYHTHSKIGDKSMQTPAKASIEEYEDRLKFLMELYKAFPSQKVKEEILKTKLLIQKWKSLL